MLNVKIMVFSDEILRDKDSDKISLINIIHDINSPSFPILLGSLCILIVFDREEITPLDLDGNLYISNNDALLFKGSLKANFENKKVNRQVIKIINLMIPNPGKLKAAFEMSDGTASEYSIMVNQIGETRIEAIDNIPKQAKVKEAKPKKIRSAKTRSIKRKASK